MNVADHAPPIPAPDFTAVKSRQQNTWASGDFSVVASRIVFQAEHLCETADLQAGWRVLDVATGSGNAALAAARRGCEVVGIDYVPALPSAVGSAPRRSSLTFGLSRATPKTFAFPMPPSTP